MTGPLPYSPPFRSVVQPLLYKQYIYINKEWNDKKQNWKQSQKDRKGDTENKLKKIGFHSVTNLGIVPI